jgi:putative hemolysin
MKADRLFEQMKKSGSDHFAVVVDEYGGMNGIITVTDLVEQLVGEFSDDEDDMPQMKLEQTGENSWLIPGSASIAEVSDELDITLPADKYDTFGGYVIDELGDIPRDGTQITIEADGLRIEVIEISHHRIEACHVEKIIPEEPENDEDE